MSDELNVWRDAKSMQEYRPLPSKAAADELSAAVIRDYGDKRYQQAIADVVDWLRSGDAFALTDHETAQEIARRFGKDT